MQGAVGLLGEHRPELGPGHAGVPDAVALVGQKLLAQVEQAQGAGQHSARDRDRAGAHGQALG